MALRRPLWQRSRLNRPATLSAPRQREPIRCSPPPPGLRHVASRTASPAAHHEFAKLLPPRDHTGLDDLLSAIQVTCQSQICEAFVAWTNVLGNSASPFHEAAVRQAQELPGPTLSEILRSLDPALSSAHDIAHGINITQGQTQFSDLRELVDEFGVRTHHRKVLAGIQTLAFVRDGSQNGLTPADYEVFLRCAGAAVDYQAAKSFWSALRDSGLHDSRTAKTWTEFIKARFMTEPMYYQFDRSRVAVLARDMYSNRSPLPMASIERMDAVRLSINALKREPWNRRPDELDEDLRRLFRRRLDFRSYKGHWVRALYYGHGMDEELLCTSMIAFARSSSLLSIKTMILKNYYGIDIDQAAYPGNTEVSGGVDLPPDSPIKPTARLLDAIVEAFGSMSHIPLGMKLVDFISRRYDVDIPKETWSNILNWTYLCASKPFKPMRKVQGTWLSTVTTTADVRQVWDVMTSGPYNIEPTFGDYDIYVKTLIEQRSFGRAVDVIKIVIMPYYDSVVDEYEKAVLDEILQRDITPSSPRATRRRNRARIQKDYVHHCISSWFNKLLRAASTNKAHRAGPVMHCLIPNLVRDFGDFFPHQIRYRTAQGVVKMERPEATRRFEWARKWRTTLPQKMAGIHVRDHEGSDQPDFPWPEVPILTVLEWQRRPKTRLTELGRAPADPARGVWWNALEEELML